MIALVDAAGKRHEGLDLELTLPLRGNWVAHLVTSDDTPPPLGRCAIEIARDGELGTVDRFVGTLRYGSTWQGRTEVSIVGGGGGLTADVTPRHYAVLVNAIPAELVAQDLVNGAGEVLSPAAALAGLSIGQWTRVATSAAQALGLLADQFGLGWRVLHDGTVWVGAETWPDATPADIAFHAGEDPDARAIDLAPNRATLTPGVVVGGRQIVRVTYTVTGGGIRARLLYGDTDRDELAAAVRPLLPPAVYGQTFGATVVAQHEDDSLDVAVDDARVPELTRIAFRVGVVGARVLLAAGTRVRVAFENGSPAGAFAIAPDADPSAAKGVARVGDAVDLGFWRVATTELGPALNRCQPGDVGAIQLTGAIVSGSAEVMLR